MLKLLPSFLMSHSEPKESVCIPIAKTYGTSIMPHKNLRKKCNLTKKVKYCVNKCDIVQTRHAAHRSEALTSKNVFWHRLDGF